jgi:hypothetical protein
VLYSRIILLREETLAQLAWTAHRTMLRGPCPIALVRTIIVHPNWFSNTYSFATKQSHLAIIFTQARSLRVLDMRVLADFAGTAMVTISQVCAASLHVLSLKVHSHDVATTFVYMRCLFQLRELLIIIIASTSDAVTDVAIDDALSWDMPFLRDLSFGKSPFPVMLSFLRRCKFPHLRTLNLAMIIDAPDVAQALARLLRGLSLHELYLPIVTPKHQKTVLPHVRAATLSFYIHPLVDGPMFIDHISASVEKLGIRGTKYPDNIAKVCAFLNHLIKVHTKLNVRDVLLLGWPEVSRWIADDVDTRTAESLQVLHRLLWYAAALTKCGIDLRDGAGKTVKDYFQ